MIAMIYLKGPCLLLSLILMMTMLPGQLASSQEARQYAKEEIDYFVEIAFDTEYGSKPRGIVKWTDDIRIKVYGSPTEADLDTLRQAIEELNRLLRDVQLSIDEGDPKLRIYFVPQSEFRALIPECQPYHCGFCWAYWDINNTIIKGNILVSTTRVSQKKRSHLIREELTQSLGLLNDSDRYPDSIFYQGWTDVTE